LRKNDGVTLIELLVSMAISVVVIAAAMTVLMMCARIQNTTSDTMSNRNSASIFLNFISNLVKDGKSSEEIADIVGCENGEIYVKSTEESGNRQVLVSNVGAYEIKKGNNFVKVSVEVGDKTYATSMRTINTTATKAENDYSTILSSFKNKNNTQTYSELVNVAISQYGSKGRIIDNEGKFSDYYSSWYSDGNWKPDTPWCACFVSWCLNQAYGESAYKFSSCTTALDKFIHAGKSFGEWHWFGGSYSPQIGDIVLFKWEQTDTEIAARSTTTADHVGIVVMVDGDTLYTIEGNTQNSVMLWKYDLSKTTVIVGYERLTAPQ